MSEPYERLSAARRAAGYSSAKIAAETFGWAVSSYVQHENGTRGIPKGKAPVYARRFNTTAEWLLYGMGEAPAGPHVPSEAELEAMLEGAQREVPATASIGDWPRYVASGLRTRLEQFLASRRDEPVLPAGQGNARGKASRSPVSTKPAAQE